jgi:hypothetical protein
MTPEEQASLAEAEESRLKAQVLADIKAWYESRGIIKELSGALYSFFDRKIEGADSLSLGEARMFYDMIMGR